MKPSEHYATADRMARSVIEVDITDPELDPAALRQVELIMQRAQVHATLAIAVDAYHRTEEGIAELKTTHDEFVATHPWPVPAAPLTTGPPYADGTDL